MRKNPARLSALLGGACLLAGCASGPQTQALAPAGFDRVTVGGELRQRIERNFDRLETDYYQPDQVYWTEEQSGGWPGDKEGRTILALVLDAQASGRTPLYLDELIRRLPRELNAKGYLGSILEGSADEQQLSGHGWLLRGLCEYYAWKKDPQVLEIARGIVDSLFLPIAPLVDRYPLSEEQRVSGAGDMSGRVQNTVDGWALSSDVGCVFIGMEGLIHSYQYIPSEESKALIDKLIALFERMDLTGIRAQTHASLTALRGMLRYAALTGDTTLIPRVEKRWKLYKEYGMTENYENYNWFERYDTWTEPCAIVDSYLLATQLWAATRNPTYLEDADKIYLNGIAATQRHDGGLPGTGHSRRRSLLVLHDARRRRAGPRGGVRLLHRRQSDRRTVLPRKPVATARPERRARTAHRLSVRGSNRVPLCRKTGQGGFARPRRSVLYAAAVADAQRTSGRSERFGRIRRSGRPVLSRGPDRARIRFRRPLGTS